MAVGGVAVVVAGADCSVEAVSIVNLVTCNLCGYSHENSIVLTDSV